MSPEPGIARFSSVISLRKAPSRLDLKKQFPPGGIKLTVGRDM
jgi:hypothetical protein